MTRISVVKWAAVLLCSNLATAHAAEVWHASTIKWIYVLSDGAFVLNLDAESPSCSSAAVPKNYLVKSGYNGMSEEGAKKLYAAVLFAAGTGKSVTINFNDSTSDCAINRLLVKD